MRSRIARSRLTGGASAAKDSAETWRAVAMSGSKLSKRVERSESRVIALTVTEDRGLDLQKQSPSPELRFCDGAD